MSFETWWNENLDKIRNAWRQADFHEVVEEQFKQLFQKAYDEGRQNAYEENQE